jgi:hypothetical protein
MSIGVFAESLMGLLAKTNPAATGESVIRQALLRGVVSVVACVVYFVWSQPNFAGWLFLVPLVGLLGAALGALMEWQLADGVDIYWIVCEVEDEFGVKLANWEEIDTVDDLYRCSLASLRDEDATDIDEEDIWQRLKALLVDQLNLKTEQIVPGARFYLDLDL